jgi:hypothetical protein
MLGMVRVDGNLDPETGELVLTALRDCQDSERRRKDPRTTAPRHSDARTPPERSVGAGCMLPSSPARPARSAHRRRRRPAFTGGWSRLPERDGARRAGPSRDRSASGVRRTDQRRRHRWRVRSSRRGAAHAGRSGAHATGHRRSRRPLSLSRLRSPASLVRRAPRAALGRWGRGGRFESGVVVPAPPPPVPRRSLPDRDGAGEHPVPRSTRGGAGGGIVRVDGRNGRYPIAPSIWSSTKRFSSTAYSIGSSRVMGSMKPFTTMAVASASDIPRDIR